MNTEQSNDVTQEVNPVNSEATAEVKQSDEPKGRLFTQDELDAIVNKRLAKERKKIDEANKLAQMSADERAKYQYDNKVAELSEKEKELNKREADFNKRAMLNQTQQELMTKNLPIDFAHLLVNDSAEVTKDNINLFEKNWNEALEKAVNEKLKTAVKEPRATRSDKGIPRKDAKKMTLAERAALKASDPEAFNKLFKR